MSHPTALLDQIERSLHGDYPPEAHVFVRERPLDCNKRMLPDIQVLDKVAGTLKCLVEVGYTRPEKLTAYRALGVDVRWYSKDGTLHTAHERTYVTVKEAPNPELEFDLVHVEGSEQCPECHEDGLVELILDWLEANRPDECKRWLAEGDDSAAGWNPRIWQTFRRSDPETFAYLLDQSDERGWETFSFFFWNQSRVGGIWVCDECGVWRFCESHRLPSSWSEVQDRWVGRQRSDKVLDRRSIPWQELLAFGTDLGAEIDYGSLHRLQLD